MSIQIFERIRLFVERIEKNHMKLSMYTDSKILLPPTMQIMKSDFEFYESKLWSLRTLSADILPVCDVASQATVRHLVSVMDGDLSSVSRACDDLIAALEEKVVKQGGNALLHPDADNSR